MVHYYLVYRKRRHTTAVRLKDHIGVVIADHRYPPLHRAGKYGLRAVDWWFNTEAKRKGEEHDSHRT